MTALTGEEVLIVMEECGKIARISEEEMQMKSHTYLRNSRPC